MVRAPAGKPSKSKGKSSQIGPSLEERQAAVLRYQLVVGLHEAARTIRDVAERLSAAAGAARALAEAAASRSPGSRSLRSLRQTLAERAEAAFGATGNSVADRFLDQRAADLVARRVGTAFDPATAGAPELVEYARALDEASVAARALPTGGADPNADARAPLLDLVAWGAGHGLGPRPLARLLAESEIDPPGWGPGRRGDRAAAWHKVLTAAR